MTIAITEDHRTLADVTRDFLERHDSKGAARSLLEADTDLAARLTTAETSITSLRTSVTSLTSNARLGFVSAKVASTAKVDLVVDAPTVLRNKTATVKVNDVAVGTVQLNAVGDFAQSVWGADAAVYTKGATVKVYIDNSLIAQGKVS